MGKLLQGVNGPFSGKVGTVVGYVLDDLPVIRAVPKKRTKPFTDKELNQQDRFSLMNQFLVPIKESLNTTFAHLAYRMKGFNKAFSYNVKAAILGFRPDLSIDYSTVLLSRGDLTKAESPTVTSTEPDVLQFYWTDNTGKGKVAETDKAFAAVYDADPGLWQSRMDLATRADGTCKLELKKGIFSGKTVHVYCGFMAADEKDASDSVYLGMVEVRAK